MRQIQMPKEDFDNLKEGVEWYEAMPSFLEVGDRFHDRMGEEMEELLPTIIEIENDDYFSLGVEVNEGKLIVNLQSVTNYLDEIQIELIPE